MIIYTLKLPLLSDMTSQTTLEDAQRDKNTFQFITWNYSFCLFYRSDQIESNCSHSNINPNDFYLPPPNGYAFHHSSFDELSSSKSKRSKVNFVEAPKVQEYQWPKVIPKSPSSFSMNSFRLHRQPAFVKCPTYNPIDEFDLDKIEYERRKSHTTLFKENIKTTDFGTAV